MPYIGSYTMPPAGGCGQRCGAGRSKLSRGYCALMPASFTTRPHLAVSDAMNLPKSAELIRPGAEHTACQTVGNTKEWNGVMFLLTRD